MRKILTILIILMIGFVAKAQFPFTQTVSNTSTLFKVKGGLGTDSVVVLINRFTDTASANNGSWIKNIPGAIIRTTGDSLWMRNSAANRWGLVNGGGLASGTVTSVGQTFTGGLISVAGSPITTSGTLALTVAGTSGGVPYFSSTSTWASSGLLAANALMIGGGAGLAPSTTTTGTGVLTALGVNVGSAGAFVTFNGAGGTPSSITLTNGTGLPISTGVSGLGTGVATALQVNVGSSGAFVTFNGALGTPSSGILTNVTGLPEGGLSLTDITTNNTSTTQHGFFPKLTTNTVYYVDNAGALVALSLGANGTVLTSNGATSAPTFTAPAGATTWNGITDPTGDQALTFQAGESSTWTDQNTIEDLFKVNNATSTTNSLFSYNRTSTALASGNNIMELVSSGANGTGGITSTALSISNTNTGSTSVNVGVNITASGATTNNAINVTAGRTLLPAGAASADNQSLYIGTTGLFDLSNTIGIYGSGTGFNSFIGGSGIGIKSTTAVIDIGQQSSFGTVNQIRIQPQAEGHVRLSTIASTSALILNARAGESTAASLRLEADEADDIPDTWNIVSETDNDLSFSNTTEKFNIQAANTTLTESSATTFISATVASGAVAGGQIVITVEANDATDYQARTLRFIWSASNKAGATTINVATPEESVAVSTGTLTVTITAVDGGSGVVNFQANAVSSLTQTILRANASIIRNY